MHASLAERLENLKPGLLWVTRDGTVRYANADATARTGLATGRKLFDPDLTRAVTAAIAGRVPRLVNSVGTAAAGGGTPSDLKCRVIPGLANDDAFVLVAQEPGSDDGAAFDNLMQAIRTEVRDPLRQAKAALALSEGAHGASQELRAMQDNLGQLLGVVDRLVELASLWDSGALLANDRIELWPLLQKAWGAVEPLALERGVKVRFRAQTEASGLATLYGSERWLGRVFQECLESAVRSARRDGLLDIEHRQLGPRAMVVFRDSGVFAARDVRSGSVELPAGRRGKGTPAPAAREQIGLRLCQHIVSLHGGQLREEEEDGLRNFLIELPTGAPHRNDQPQLDIAQAQVYARDLAALMTRSRKKPAAAAAVAAETR
jgi:signal transduction histidine kinase